MPSYEPSAVVVLVFDTERDGDHASTFTFPIEVPFDLGDTPYTDENHKLLSDCAGAALVAEYDGDDDSAGMMGWDIAMYLAETLVISGGFVWGVEAGAEMIQALRDSGVNEAWGKIMVEYERRMM